jgi:glycosyltransferase involved in cell wall biosynthesis
MRENPHGNSCAAGLRSAIRAFVQSWRHTFRFVWQNPSCFQRPSLTVDGIDIYRLPAWGPIQSIRARFFSLSAAWYLVRNRHRYDVVHLVGTAWITPLGILLGKLLGKKTVVEMILLGADDPETIARRRFGKINLAIWKQVDRIASLSPALTESCRRMNVAPEKIVVIPVGVDVQRFSPLRNKMAVKQLREKLGLPKQARLVVFVGGIVRRKGVDLLIDAWALVTEKEPDVHLICIGPAAFSAASAGK